MAAVEGNQSLRAVSSHSPLINRSHVSSVCSRVVQPAWLKALVHLASLIEVISDDGSKHSRYKVRHERTRAEPGV